MSREEVIQIVMETLNDVGLEIDDIHELTAEQLTERMEVVLAQMDSGGSATGYVRTKLKDAIEQLGGGGSSETDLENLGADIAGTTDINATEGNGEGKTPVAYSKGDIFYIGNRTTQSEKFDGRTYYVSNSNGTAGMSLSDTSKFYSTTSGADAVRMSQDMKKGAANGVASLDEQGVIPQSQVNSISLAPQTLNETQKVQAQNNMMGKAYAPAKFSGLGKKMLAKNIQQVSGVSKNVMTQAFFEDEQGNALTNTVFVIQYDYTLGENITVPANCVLEFDGGSISGGHSLMGNGTEIVAGQNKIFADELILDGTYNISEFKAAWYGLTPDDNTIDWGAKMTIILDNIERIFKLHIWSAGIGRSGIKVSLLPGVFTSTTTLNIDKYTNLRGVNIEGASNRSTYIVNVGNSYIIQKTTTDYPCINIIKNIIFQGNGTHYGLSIISPYGLHIEDCYFWACTEGVTLYLTVDTYIERCHFFSCDHAIILSTTAGVGPSTTFYIKECWIQHCDTGILAATSLNSQGGYNGVSGIWIEDSTVEYCQNHAIDFEDYGSSLDNFMLIGHIKNTHIEQNDVYITGGYVTIDKCVTDNNVTVTKAVPSHVIIRDTQCTLNSQDNRMIEYYPGNGELFDFYNGRIVLKRGIVGRADRFWKTVLVRYGGDDGYYLGIIDWSEDVPVEITKIAGNLTPSFTNNYFYIGTHNTLSQACSLEMMQMGITYDFG